MAVVATWTTRAGSGALRLRQTTNGRGTRWPRPHTFWAPSAIFSTWPLLPIRPQPARIVQSANYRVRLGDWLDRCRNHERDIGRWGGCGAGQAAGPRSAHAT